MPSVRSFTTLHTGRGLAMHEPFYDDYDYDPGDEVSSSNVATMERSRPVRRRIMHIPCLDTQSVGSGSTTSTGDSSNTKSSYVHWVVAGITRVIHFLLTNVVVSIIIILLGLGLSLGLGAVTFFAVKPPEIDKSFVAFAIPNHAASRRQDALDQAIKEMREIYFQKRQTRSVYSEENSKYVADYRQSLQQMYIPPEMVFDPLRKAWDYFSSDIIDRYMHHSAGHGDDDGYIDVVPEGLRSTEHTDIRRVKKSVFREYLREKLLEVHDAKDPRISRERRSTSGIPLQSQLKWRMELVYLAQGDGDHNIFTPERLETIHEIEHKVMGHHERTKFCYKNYEKLSQDNNLHRYDGCAPLNSLLTYFYPSVTDDGMIHYDSMGSVLEDINTTLSFAMTKETFFWYVDDQISNTNRRSKLLRSEVHFGVPIQGFTSPKDKAQEDVFIDFVVTYMDLLSTLSTSKVRVLYGSNQLFDYQVDQTFWNDVRLAMYAFAFICVLMFVLTSFSVWLTFWGMVCILLSFPLALFLYRIAFQVKTLGILNGAAAFVIIGIGVDDVFVFVNTFRQADHMHKLEERMMHTVFTAGKATFFTSFTTAAAFAANVASSIPAVHEFGLFMSLIVACCWVMVVLMMPPVINLWYRWFSTCEFYCFRCCRCANSRCNSLQLPPDMADFLGREKTEQEYQDDVMSSENSPLMSDVQLLSLETGGTETPDGEIVSDDDDPLLQLENELQAETDDVQVMPPAKKSMKTGCDLTAKFRALLFFYVARPVIKARYVILVLFLLILGGSVALMIRLEPASKPPQLFKSDTNLQQLLDLAANLSDSGVKCDKCSGFYKELSVQKPRTTTQTSLSNLSSFTSPGVTPELNGSTTTPSTTSEKLTKTPTTTKKPGETTTTTAKTTSTTTAKPTTTTTATTSTTSKMTTTKRPKTTTKDKKTTTTTTTSQPSNPPVINETPTLPPGSTKGSTPESPDDSYNPCDHGKCDEIKERPSLELGAAIYVVFGITDIDRGDSNNRHVLNDKGTTVYDEQFAESFKKDNLQLSDISDLCKVCNTIANNTKLVVKGGSQCLPKYGIPSRMSHMLRTLPECENLPENMFINGKRLPARAMAGLLPSQDIKWIAFAFESTTYKGQSYFEAYKQYQEWEDFIDQIKTKVLSKNTSLRSIYQTSDFWKDVMMEVVAVSSAIYGLVFSMLICVSTVAIFTGHLALLFVVVITIGGEICLVLAIFYLAGWEMGAVEAVSLSILVGSSVDYCLHLVEGYLLAGTNPPASVKQSNPKLRRWRTLAAICHIGLSIVSSAITTIVASIPLTQTYIRPFSKFGQIVAINTTVSIVYTLTICAALLAIMAPARFRISWKAVEIAFVVTAVFIGALIGSLYGLSRHGIHIPGPSGEDLFPTSA